MTVDGKKSILRSYFDSKKADNFCELVQDTIMGYNHAYTDFDSTGNEQSRKELEERLVTLATMFVYCVVPSKKYHFQSVKVEILP